MHAVCRLMMSRKESGIGLWDALLKSLVQIMLSRWQEPVSK